jgi:ribosomal-protein-alanine N-acetyltransferase
MRFPLTGDRIELRPFVAEDAPTMQGVYGDPAVMRWVGDGPTADVDGAAALLAGYIAHQDRYGFSSWALVDRATGTLFGDAGLGYEHGQVHLGYTLAQAWWGRGYATEAARLCVAAAFDELYLPSVRAIAEPENAASIRVLEKAGFRAVGHRLAYGREHAMFLATRWPARAAV